MYLTNTQRKPSEKTKKKTGKLSKYNNTGMKDSCFQSFSFCVTFISVCNSMYNMFLYKADNHTEEVRIIMIQMNQMLGRNKKMAEPSI